MEPLEYFQYCTTVFPSYLHYSLYLGCPLVLILLFPFHFLLASSYLFFKNLLRLTCSKSLWRLTTSLPLAQLKLGTSFLFSHNMLYIFAAFHLPLFVYPFIPYLPSLSMSQIILFIDLKQCLDHSRYQISIYWGNKIHIWWIKQKRNSFFKI